MKKMQDGAGANGSVLSIAGEVLPATGAVRSPPSASNAECFYGEVNTSATLSTAGAFAYASIVLKGIPSLVSYAADLLARAEKAWTWAVANPAVFFQNNDAASNTSGLGAGQQEVSATALAQIKLDASALLFAATGSTIYQG
jgi:hypothetical protein